MMNARCPWQPQARTLAFACTLVAGALPAQATQAPPASAVPAGTVLTLPLAALHPTQPAVGRDEILARLGRWRAEPERWAHDPAQQLRHIHRTLEHKFASYCKDMGQGGLKTSFSSVAQAQAARLNDPTTFACAHPPPAGPADAGYADLATVVAGPDGAWYLTDGHHGMTALWEVPDGGPTLQVRVRVLDAINTTDAASFWQTMAERGHAWLQTPDGQPLPPAALPRHLRLQTPPGAQPSPKTKADAAARPEGLADDPYRSLVYFTRNLGYRAGDLPDFAEFHWANWLRAQAQRAEAPWRLDDYQRDTLNAQPPGGYVQAVRDAAQRMRSLPADALVSDHWTAQALGQQAGGEAGDQTVKGTLSSLARSDEDAHGRARTGGKLWYAVRERQRENGEQPLQPPAQP